MELIMGVNLMTLAFVCHPCNELQGRRLHLSAIQSAGQTVITIGGLDGWAKLRSYRDTGLRFCR